MPGELLVTSIVLNHGDPSDTLRCVASLGASTHLAHRVLVVDNGSDDEHVDALAAGLDGVELLRTGENLGYGAGNNVGIRRALRDGTDLVLVVNPDVVVRPDALARLVAAAEERPDAGILGPRVLRGAGPAIWFDGAELDLGRGGATHHRGVGRRHAPNSDWAVLPTDYVVGSSMLLRASVLRLAGLVPEHYFLYFEETDLNLRVARAGWSRLVVQAAVVEHHRRSMTRVPGAVLTYYFLRGRLLFAREFTPDLVDVAWEDVRGSWVEPWRERVAERAPSWLATFERLVEAARADGTAGVTGRRDDVHELAPPVVEE